MKDALFVKFIYKNPLQNLGSISVLVFSPHFPLRSGFHFQKLFTSLIICVCIPQWKGVLRYILCDFEANFLRTNWNNSKAQFFLSQMSSLHIVTFYLLISGISYLNAQNIDLNQDLQNIWIVHIWEIFNCQHHRGAPSY